MSAVVGSTVTIGEGNHIFARGVCWGTEPNPNIDGNHIAGDNVAGSQSVTLDGLVPNTTYNVRAYAVTDYGLTYGEEQSFTTEQLPPNYIVTVSSSPSNGGTVTGGGTYEEGQSCTVHATANSGYTFFLWMENGSVVSTDATYTFTVNADRTLVANFDNHAFVDLGLPNGTLWATCNIGADAPESYGDFFAWGETQPKEVYDWNTYLYANGTSWQNAQLIKYCSTDGLTTLLPEDDAATANWGDGWRMPTKGEWMELLQNTTNTWTTQNGVYGRLFIASNGNTLFLPAAGYYFYGSFYGPSDRFGYWSRTLGIDDYQYGNVSAWMLQSFSSSIKVSSSYRAEGMSIRAVRCKTTPPAGVINGLFSVSANKQVYFSKGNLQYKASSNTWRFAENQFDYIGNSNSNISSSYSGWIDLFGWGTSGYDHGAVCYQPWSTSTNYSDYYAYDRSDFNLNYETGQADWGFNRVSNGGNTTSLWRTLTKEEWKYVISTRTTASGIRYAKAKVNSINGVILLPDNWSENTYSLNNTNISNAGFDSNVITTSQWTILENAGAVFLPCAGYRSGTSVSNIGSYGRYYSASIVNYGYEVVSVYCDNSYFFDYYADDRYLGFSVRLVHDVE